MKIDSLNANNFISSAHAIEPFAKPQKTFTDWLMAQVQETNGQLLKAEDALQQLAMGRAENLHQVMLSLEKAKLSFHFLEQVRTRLMNAYQTLLREQI